MIQQLIENTEQLKSQQIQKQDSTKFAMKMEILFN